MVEDLLREFVGEDWIQRLDFSTLERVNASYVSENMRHRESDVVWKLKLRDGRPVCVYLLIEFQSKVDRFMAVRMMVYVGLLYQTLISQKELTPSGKLPLVLPILLYGGERRWRGALDLADLIEVVDPAAEQYVPRLRYKLIDERSYSTEDLQGRNSLSAVLFQLEKREEGWPELWKAVGRLMALLSSFQDDSLTATFRTWLEREILQQEGAEEIPETANLEEFHTMLQKRIAEMNRRLQDEARLEGIHEGEEKGVRKGRKEGELRLLTRLLEGKFGPLDPRVQAKLRSADSDRLLEWGDRLVTAKRLSDVFGDD